MRPGSPDHLEMVLTSGRSAYERQEWRAAIDAFKRALTLDPANPEAHTFLALILSHAGHADDALVAIERALAKDPAYPFALWAKGVALFEAKQDYAGAITAWETLKAQNLAPEEADRVSEMIAEAKKRLVAQPAEAPRRPSPGGMITGTVTLEPSLRARVPAGGALFIVARKGNGPPAAVKRILNPAFPVTFSLGPEDQMVGGTPFEGAVKGPVTVGQRGIEIVLDRVR